MLEIFLRLYQKLKNSIVIRRKGNLMFALKSISWGGLVLLFAGLTIAAANKSTDYPCDKIRVVIEKDKNLGFVNSKDIVREVNQSNPNWSQAAGRNLKPNMIENHIKNNEYVKNVHVYIDQNRNLNVYIVPKAPIFRIHDKNNSSYYIAEDWDRMNINHEFSSRVIHILGEVDGLLYPRTFKDSFILAELKLFSKYIEKNKNWNTAIDQIFIDASGKFELTMIFTDPGVQIGYIDSKLERKMEKVKNFFKLVPYHKSLDNYSKLNFEYNQQVIATKK